MGIEMKRGAKRWYGRYRDGGKIQQIKLATEVGGERPARLSEKGDAAFERSRKRAEAEFAQRLHEIRGDLTAEKIAQRVAEAKTGRKIEFPKLADLPALWLELPQIWQSGWPVPVPA